MSETAKIELGGKTYEFPVIEGTENEKAIDISKLRDLTGYITMDQGYKNTGACKSSVTFLDGEEGILITVDIQLNRLQKRLRSLKYPIF
jgi:citrate synthase